MVFWVILVLILLIAFQMFEMGKTPEYRISYSEFIRQVETGNIKKIVIKGLEVHGTLLAPTIIPVGPPDASEGKQRELRVENFSLILPAEDKDIPQRILEKNENAIIEGEIPGGSLWVKLLTSGLPLLLIVGLWLLIMRQMQAGGNRAFSFGKSRARMFGGDRPRITFEDVAGTDEAKEELQEIIEFLKDPKKFQKLGGRIPKGALLLGPPGTGKTLLARAVAGEANVPFFSMSGSDFVEMFVGVGASRVRDLFDQGKKHAPCILFIDELDAVGRHRGAGLGGGHDEREQTLNQLLVEMDGFESNEGVILLAATNRPDVLDPALLRPGRFDRRIIVDMPDVHGREGIFKVHTRKIPLAEDVDLHVLARGTPGMSGADLANMVNEAALLAARYDKNKVSMEEFEEAKDKILLGPEKKSRIIKEDVKRLTAYHEAGHAVVGAQLKYSDPIHKVTIIPRGRAGGVTFFLPEDDRTEVSKDWCLDTITQSLGGRVAEQLILNRMGSGAQQDIEMATKLVRKMVMRWGMSSNLGPISFGEREEQIFLGREIAQHQDYSETTAQAIDEEVSRIITECYDRAKKILEENMDQLHAVADALLERETLDREEIDILLKGGELPPLKIKSADKEHPGEKPKDAATEADKDALPKKPPPFAEPDTSLAE
ncbi:MAG: ATP-dependent zinc metalloprotease FtsH [Candidatus Latescibacteria bacterium]|nr:ATP-dependent zinc metalloprotease FtsH [Candidatus Latescibacterota bacterium]NIM66411.1 ATP-dependent zinc metalloprotease FtsH [Candidatus Latescibacterota bacterium]NIO02890.1 ATP-dependent zinc metalloprotease FtsH [Candidatus Latescibacterota bacterium]NIO30025.1 ATP-dependent zinc metalloprotease FtsH [Candidatus Latescibacterota bacterium]NIO57640.1 ATP-dependent zinc metalloprotease FtsH [Candidatus Latescibacterota bacterium]